MRIRDAVDYARRTHQRPANIVIAFNEPVSLNEVILNGPYRLRIVRSLTRAEFMAAVHANLQKKDAVMANTTVTGARMDLAEAEDTLEPGPEMRYFYAAELV